VLENGSYPASRIDQEQLMPDYVNHFASPVFVEEVIRDKDDKVIGTIRIKPSGVLWKPANSPKFYSITLSKFTEWIMDPATGASRTKS
jgi:hypothetical protein